MYPLVPKSTKTLVPGQFWSVPLRDGRFACGRVLQVGASEIPSPNRAFFGGLHNWVEAVPPTADTAFGPAFIGFGVMHLRAIASTGGAILGERPLSLDEIVMPAQISAQGGRGTLLLFGADKVRAAENDEWGTLPVLGYWGVDFIQELANAKLLRAA